jgi:TetR/AcrR family transcriptional regulator, fatty acid metabolism regulator protein
MPSSMTHRPSLKERQRQEREGLILQAAEEVLLEKGYHDASMDEIAARVGVSKGTVYLHFPSKEDLIVAILTRDIQKLIQVMDDIIASQQTVREKLTAIFNNVYNGYFGKRARLLYELSNSTEARSVFMQKKACIRELREDVMGKVQALLEEGKATHEFTPSIPTSVMVNVFFGLLLPNSYERLMTEQRLPPDEIAHYLEQIYFKGIDA